jgi:hypothetical protein
VRGRRLCLACACWLGLAPISAARRTVWTGREPAHTWSAALHGYAWPRIAHIAGRKTELVALPRLVAACGKDFVGIAVDRDRGHQCAWRALIDPHGRAFRAIAGRGRACSAARADRDRKSPSSIRARLPPPRPRRSPGKVHWSLACSFAAPRGASGSPRPAERSIVVCRARTQERNEHRPQSTQRRRLSLLFPRRQPHVVCRPTGIWRTHMTLTRSSFVSS